MPVYRILPELLLTITGVLAMLIEPIMPPGMTRKPIGVLALLGVIAALGGQRVASVTAAGNGILRHGADRCLQRLLPCVDLQHCPGRAVNRL